MMKSLIVLLFISNIFNAPFAKALDSQLIQSAYQSHNQSFQLYCSIFDKTNTLLQVKAIGELEFSIGSKLQQSFELLTNKETLIFDLSVFPRNNKSEFLLEFASGERFSGTVKESSGRLFKKEIRPDVSNLNNSFYQRNKLSQLTCYVEFAHAKAIVLEANQHLSVHPHSRYDYRGLLTHKIENLAYGSVKNYVLLEDGNFKENLVDLYDFLMTGKIDLPTNDYGVIKSSFPKTTQLVVSPAGHNRYVFTSNAPVSVTYSGGNHNYCIWNNTRKVMSALLESQFSAPLSINYETDSIVVQCGSGIIRGLGISCRSVKSTNLLSDILNSLKSSKKQKYHQAFFQFFVSNTIANYQHRFKKVYFSYYSKDFKRKEVINGNGSKVLNIKVNYN